MMFYCKEQSIFFFSFAVVATCLHQSHISLLFQILMLPRFKIKRDQSPQSCLHEHLLSMHYVAKLEFSLFQNHKAGCEPPPIQHLLLDVVLQAARPGVVGGLVRPPLL